MLFFMCLHLQSRNRENEILNENVFAIG
jgi:hypothetical protein